jgi:hypothetical protein
MVIECAGWEDVLCSSLSMEHQDSRGSRQRTQAHTAASGTVAQTQTQWYW